MGKSRKITGYLNSYFSEQVIESYSSRMNPQLEVSLINGRYQLNAGNVNYSFGPLHDAFRKYFKKDAPVLNKESHVLLLGLGAGSVIRILKDELGIGCKFTGVEADEAVLEVASRHFDLDKISGLSVVNADAAEFIETSSEEFDCIVIDIYIDDEVPVIFETRDFLQGVFRCLKPGGKVVFNKLQKLNHDNSKVRALIHLFEMIFNDVKVIKIPVNKQSPNFFITGRKTQNAKPESEF